jgi:hypothetical protein
MSRRTRSPNRTTSPPHATRVRVRRSDDDRFDQMMTDALRAGAEERAARDEARLIDDARANDRLNVALHDLMDGARHAGSR